MIPLSCFRSLRATNLPRSAGLPRTGAALVALLLLLSPLRATRAAELSGGCDVRFEATSTLHGISGTARCRDFVATLAAGRDGRQTVSPFRVEVAVADMKTGNRSRDARMREMFESGRYPSIRASVDGLQPGRLRARMREGAGGRAVVELSLGIRDVVRPVRATLSNLRESPGTATLDVEFPVSLREFGLEAPTVLGFVRVGDKVVVRATVRIAGIPADQE